MLKRKIFSLLLLIACSICFATEVEQMTVLTRQGLRSISYEEIDELAITEGDIILAKTSDLYRKHAIIAVTLGGTRWRGGIIPYEIAENLPFPNKLAVMQAIEHWQKKTNVHFVEITAENRHDYQDYIVFIANSHDLCSSYVGKHGGRQEIHLSPRCDTLITIHEIGHAAGLWHEHSRGDRDSYVRILWENIADDHKFNFNQHITDGEDYGAYDYLSIMHYGFDKWSKNGLKTMEPLVAGIELGKKTGLSEKDIAAINYMYPET